jgi:hypothetical protein
MLCQPALFLRRSRRPLLALKSSSFDVSSPLFLAFQMPSPKSLLGSKAYDFVVSGVHAIKSFQLQESAHHVFLSPLIALA